MKLKLDDEGIAVLQDGMPVYVHDDGKEIPFDGARAFSKISELGAENKSHRERADALAAQMKAFEGVNAEEARKALELAKNIKDGDLLKADKVEELKKQYLKSIEESFSAKEKALLEKITESEKTLASKDDSIRRLLIKGAFDSSKFLTEKTTLPPDMAFTHFGKHFTVEDHNGDLRIVAKDSDGNTILSRTRHGDAATPEEAIESIIEKYQFKDHILKSTPGGAGTPTNSGGSSSGGKSMKRATFDALDATAKASAVKDGVKIVD